MRREALPARRPSPSGQPEAHVTHRLLHSGGRGMANYNMRLCRSPCWQAHCRRRRRRRRWPSSGQAGRFVFINWQPNYAVVAIWRAAANRLTCCCLSSSRSCVVVVSSVQTEEEVAAARCYATEPCALSFSPTTGFQFQAALFKSSPLLIA